MQTVSSFVCHTCYMYRKYNMQDVLTTPPFFYKFSFIYIFFLPQGFQMQEEIFFLFLFYQVPPFLFSTMKKRGGEESTSPCSSLSLFRNLYSAFPDLPISTDHLRVAECQMLGCLRLLLLSLVTSESRRIPAISAHSTPDGREERGVVT